MGQWLKANGGALALVFVGLGLTGYTTPYGWILVGSGILWWLWEHRPRRQRDELDAGADRSVVKESATVDRHVATLQITPADNELQQRVEDNKRELQAAARLLRTELLDIRHKIEMLNVSPILSEGYAFPASEWYEQRRIISRNDALYDVVSTAYTAAHRVNEIWRWRRTQATTRMIAANLQEDGLEAVDQAAQDAIKALERVIESDKPLHERSTVREASRRILQDEQADDLLTLLREGLAIKKSIPYGQDLPEGSLEERAIESWAKKVREKLSDDYPEWAIHFDTPVSGHVFRLKHRSDELRSILEPRMIRLSQIVQKLKGTAE